MGNFPWVLKFEQTVICCTFVAKMEHCEQTINAELQVRLFQFRVRIIVSTRNAL